MQNSTPHYTNYPSTHRFLSSPKAFLPDSIKSADLLMLNRSDMNEDEVVVSEEEEENDECNVKSEEDEKYDGFLEKNVA